MVTSVLFLEQVIAIEHRSFVTLQGEKGRATMDKVWNVTNVYGTPMLEDNVTKEEAGKWCHIYKARYPKGKPYPNGKGMYYSTFTVEKMD